MPNASLTERLRALEPLSSVPLVELEWLVGHGQPETYAAGTVLFLKGSPVDRLLITLSGRVGLFVDRGTGERRVVTWNRGDIHGMLPYSRMTHAPGIARCETDTELLAVPTSEFHDMVCACPVFTAHSVHFMLDRARTFNASDLRDEKMVSLGKLAAGLAHELNNPASAAARSATLLRESVEFAIAAVRALQATGASERVFEAIARTCTDAGTMRATTGLSAIARADHEDEVADWLERHGMDRSQAEAIVESGVSIPALDELATKASGATLAAALEWMTARCETRALATTIERSATRIHDLVGAVKRFTFMDNLAGPEFADVEQGLRDTLSILSSKTKAKNANISLQLEEGLPRARAAGGELNQVWLNLIDNALDAMPTSGHLTVSARREGARVIVSVIDDGPGIPADVLPKVFDQFFTTKPSGEGTGLGLDIARQLVRQHDGEITATSVPGRTEFRVSLLAEPQAGTRA